MDDIKYRSVKFITIKKNDNFGFNKFDVLLLFLFNEFLMFNLMITLFFF